jgi:hypothetical protein
MKILKNRFFVIIAGILIIIISQFPIYERLWLDIKSFYLTNEFNNYFTEIYWYSFLWLQSWLSRLIAASINLFNSKKKISSYVIWILLSILLPGLSLILNGILTNNKKKNIKIFSIMISLMILLIIGTIITSRIQYTSKQKNIQKYTNTYTSESIELSVIEHIDSLVKTIDTGRIDRFVISESNKITYLDSNNYFAPIKDSGHFQLVLSNDSGIRIIKEISNNGNKDSYFNENGKIVLKRYIHTQNFSKSPAKAYELVKEYYKNDTLIKRTYKIINQQGNEIRPTDCKFNERDEFKDFNSLKEFRELSGYDK